MKDSTKEHKAKSLSELKQLSYKNDIIFKIGRLNFETPLKKFLDSVHQTFESMIYHKNLFEQETQKECSIILLKGKLIKSPVITASPATQDKSNPILILDIQRILDLYLEPSGNYFIIKLTYINDISLDNQKPMTLRFENQREAQIFKYFVEKEKINAWQIFFEKNIPIPEPFYYQYHFFLKKVNSRGEQENRVIVLTNEYILNIDYQIIKGKEPGAPEFSFKLHKPKWALSIKSFEELQLIEKDKKKKTPSFMIKIKVNKNDNKTYVMEKKLPFKNKNSTDFMFQNEKSCRYFIFQIKKLYYNLNLEKKFIKVTQG